MDTIPDIILRRPQVSKMTGDTPKSTLYAWMKKGLFPKPVRLSERSVGWRMSDVQEWLASRASPDKPLIYNNADERNKVKGKVSPSKLDEKGNTEKPLDCKRSIKKRSRLR